MARGGAGEPVAVRVALADDTTDAVTVSAPASGRTSAAGFVVPVRGVSDTAEWLPIDAIVESRPEDGVVAGFRRWVRVTPEPTGAVLVSLDPDWEPRFLAPVLERSVPGGARAFLRTGEGSWVGVGQRPAGGIAEETVRGAAAAAALLLIQGDPTEIPAWLRAQAADRPAVLYLARGPGRLPGTDITVGGGLPGEWYVSLPPPAGPLAARLMGAEASSLPSLTPLRGVEGPTVSPVLEVRRAWQGQGDAAASARALSRLLRRYALARFPRQRAAALTGEDWLSFLDAHGGGGRFRDGPGRLLADAPYRRIVTAPVAELAEVVQAWIQHNREVRP